MVKPQGAAAPGVVLRPAVLVSLGVCWTCSILGSALEAILHSNLQGGCMSCSWSLEEAMRKALGLELNVASELTGCDVL